MLNIIYAGSLALTIALLSAKPALSNNWQMSVREEIGDRVQLAKGRHYESDYRNEADRIRERHQNNRENYRREHYRYDPYEVQYDRDGRGRTHRDAEQRRREENRESEYYRYRPRPESERPRYRPEGYRNHRDRDRDRHRSIYYWNY